MWQMKEDARARAFTRALEIARLAPLASGNEEVAGRLSTSLTNNSPKIL